MTKCVNSSGVTHLWEKIEEYVTGRGYLTSLAHSHTLTIGNSTKTVSANGAQSWTAGEMGVRALTQANKAADCVHVVTGDGKNYYIRFASLTINAQYVDYDIQFEIAIRREYISRLHVKFQNSTGTDPYLYGFCADNSNKFWINKRTTSTWDLYAYSADIWGDVRIYGVSGRNLNEGITIEYASEHLSSLPSTCSQASPIGYAWSAIRLKTARTINGTSFNGTANITTANWGTARNISISDSAGTNTGTAVSVNGAEGVTLKLPATIAASITGHASLDLPLTGGTMTGKIDRSSGGSWITGRDHAVVRQMQVTEIEGWAWNPVTAVKTFKGCWTMGTVGGESYLFSYDTDENYNNSTNTSVHIRMPMKEGTLALTTDNVASATKLATARTLTIGNTGKTFDGSGNVSWSLAEIGQYLPYVYTDTVDSFFEGVGRYVNAASGTAITTASVGTIIARSNPGNSAYVQYLLLDGVWKQRTGATAKNASTNENVTSWGSWTTIATTYSAGSGLSMSGTTLNHAATIAAGTAGTSSATSGCTIAVPYVTYNATGHITAAGTHTHTVNNIPNSSLQNSKVTIGSTAVSLGGTVTAIAGLTSVAATTFTEGGTSLANKYAAKSHTHSYLPLSGGTMTGNLTCSTSGASLTWGNTVIYGGGSNGGVNSMRIGDDAYIGDCNVGGCIGIKSSSTSGTYAGVAFFNGAGSSLGRIVSNNGTLQWVNSSNTPYNVYHSGNLSKLSQLTNDSGFITSSGSITGNASSATKLQTARTINGTNFDGTAGITTANWGTARNISISDSAGTNTGAAVSVNGSAAVTLKLPATIAASLSGNASSATKLQTARTLWGQSFNGSANVSGNMSGVGQIKMNNGAQIIRAGASTSWYNGRDGALLRHLSHTSGTYTPILSEKTNDGSWELGAFNNNFLHLCYITDTNYTNKTNTPTVDITIRPDKLVEGIYLKGSRVQFDQSHTLYYKDGSTYDCNEDTTLDDLLYEMITAINSLSGH